LKQNPLKALQGNF